ncbi:endo-1,3;1,4-beta-D-glucanase isoform X1 [Elaeis guineensis]|uniref:endo-1,3;1,4-beta-D-glucanase isoform X1 n=1 Tax=Elaeis guineensis var. tenera TaxID=51953 RepID=UPI003C6D5583
MASSQCCEHPPTLNPASGQGCVVDDLGGLKAYTVGPPACKTAILLLSDVFGYEAPNLRKLADKVAAAGFFVVVPDFFRGDPYVPDKKPLDIWLGSHGTDKGFEDAKLVIEALKNKGVSTIGAAGFCWGAKVVADLAKYDYIKAAVMLHPSFVTVDDIKLVKCHLAILGAEIDKMSPPELLKQFEEILSLKSEVNSYVKIFPGVVHGWTVRYDTGDETAVKKAEESHQDMLEWFAKHLN